MATWQFWTLIGSLTFLNVWIASHLQGIENAVDRTNSILVSLQDDIRSIHGTLVGLGNDVEKIKFRAQRD